MGRATTLFSSCGLALAAVSIMAPAAQAADFTWSTGDFTSGVTAPDPLSAGDTLWIQSGGTKRFVGGSFSNQGLVRWQADALQGGNSATVTNSGIWQSESDANSLTWTFGGRPTFTNTGTFRKSAGVATDTGNWAFVNNGGLIDANVGNILFTGDANTFNAGTRFSGAGQVINLGFSTFNGGFQSDNFLHAAGTLTGNGAVLSGGVAAAPGAMGWSGGDLSGSWTIATGSTLTASGADAKRQVGSNLTNNGTLIWNSGVALQGGNSSVLTTFQWIYGGRPTLTNEAGGTISATNNSTLTIGNYALTSHGGLFNADAGSAIVYGGDANRFNDGTRFVGDHRMISASRYVGTIQSDTLRWISGTQTGGDGVTPGSAGRFAGQVAWEGGDLSGRIEIMAGAVLTASGADAKRQVGSNLTNNGTLIWNSGVALQGGNSSVLTDMRADAAVQWVFGGQAALVNDGLFIKTAGAGTSSLSSLALTNNGTIDVRAGSIALPSNFVNTGTLKGTGSFDLTGTLQNDGHVAPGASPGTLTIHGNFAQSGLGSLDVELESLALHDMLLVEGDVSLGGTLALTCWASCQFAAGDEFMILDALGELTGGFSGITLAGFGTGAFAVIYDRDLDRVLLRVTEAVSPPASVPEPGTLGLLLSGLAIAARLKRRQRAPCVEGTRGAVALRMDA